MPSEMTMPPEPAAGAEWAGSFGAKLRVRRQNVMAFGAVLLLVSAAAGGLFFWGNTAAALFVQTGLLLTLGYLHSLILANGLRLLNERERLQYSAVLAAAVLVVVGGIAFFSPHFSWLPVAVGGCAFLLPFTVWETWRSFETLALGEATPWYPATDMPLQKSTTFLNSMPVRFAVQVDQYEKAEERVSFRAPVRMKLGLIFYHMLQDQKARHPFFAEIAEGEAEAYGWVFYRKGLLGPHYLDPEAGLLENEIKENAMVTARRFRRDAVSE